MFIELAEHLACPTCWPEQNHCVLVPDEVVGRMVTSGTINCPLCHAEYPIKEGVVLFGVSAETPASVTLPPPAVIQALLDLSGPGGYVVLVGSASSLAGGLLELQSGVNLVSINPPASYDAPLSSVLLVETTIPLRNVMARGVVVGADYVPMLAEADRVLLRGGRLVVLDEVALPPTIAPLATQDGMTVGAKEW